MFYAAIHDYGIEFSNDVRQLRRFPTKAERDRFVDQDRFDGNFHRESVTRNEARGYLPEAFRASIDGLNPNTWDKLPDGSEGWNLEKTWN